MGADIHLYVEFASKEPRDFERARGTRWWQSFGERMNPGRNYLLFGALADVRTGPALIEPRGMPEDPGLHAQWDNHLTITEDGEEERCCTLEQAQRYATYGCTIIERDGKPVRVTHPDWHSHTWLTTDEFEAALNEAGVRDPIWKVGIQYRAILAAMRTLEDGGKNEARVIMWFDN